MPDFIYNPFALLHDLLIRLLAPFLPPWAVQAVDALAEAVAVLTVALLSVMFWVYLERRIVGRLQNRIGPNRVGPFGILQTVADTIKLLIKEDIVPLGTDKAVFLLAPVLVAVPALLVYAVIPFGPGVVVADLNIALLYLIAISSLTTLGILLAGWSSNNKYSLLGAMRAAAQVISYEVPLVLSLIGVMMLAGTMSLNGIVEAQRPLWFFIWQPLGLLIFLVAGIAELNRTPFDLVEGESEIVAVYHIEYSGMRFALFFLAEYLNAFVLSALAATLFFGGWLGPPIVGATLPPYIWFALKALVFMFVLFWVRGTLPRLRVDQLMGFCWKFLLPLGLANIFISGLEVELLKVIRG